VRLLDYLFLVDRRNPNEVMFKPLYPIWLAFVASGVVWCAIDNRPISAALIVALVAWKYCADWRSQNVS